jgi:phosphoglycolate phosphatase
MPPATLPTILLFDIDGTLILTGGAGRKAMEAAFSSMHGAGGAAVLDFSFGGMTDQAIVRTGLRALGHDAPDGAHVDRILDAYLLRLEEEVARSDAYRVLPGVVAVLDWLHSLTERAASMAVGLGTGNVKRGAYAKLTRGSLQGRFPFGGFGCDAEDRGELLRMGATRGAAQLGVPLSSCRVVVIGDTPKDVAAARSIGAECVGVGTGGFDPAALLTRGANAAFATLEDDGVREALLEPAGHGR